MWCGERLGRRRATPVGLTLSPGWPVRPGAGSRSQQSRAGLPGASPRCQAERGGDGGHRPVLPGPQGAEFPEGPQIPIAPQFHRRMGRSRGWPPARITGPISQARTDGLCPPSEGTAAAPLPQPGRGHWKRQEDWVSRGRRMKRAAHIPRRPHKSPKAAGCPGRMSGCRRVWGIAFPALAAGSAPKCLRSALQSEAGPHRRAE